MPRKHRLAIMTVFLPRENLFFLEEWLLYHLHVGVDHVYFYDNAGSRSLLDGQSLEVTGKNKHGAPVYAILAHLDDAAVHDRLLRILAPYRQRGYVTLVPWQPRDEQGAIAFRQPQAYVDYIARFAAGADWTAFIDLDEFLVSPLYGELPPLLDDLDADGVQVVHMVQKAFPGRFTEAGQPVPDVLTQTRCDPVLIDNSGPKTLVRSDVLVVPEQVDGWMIHHPPVRDGVSWFTDPDVLRFNHYRYSETVIVNHRKWSGRTVTLSSEDAGMLPHAAWIAAHRHSAGGRDAGVRSRPPRQPLPLTAHCR